MTSVARSLAGIAAALDERGRRWALVGSLAVSCHFDPRFTRDVDIVVDDDDAEALKALLAGATPAELREVAASIDLIEQRGYRQAAICTRCFGSFGAPLDRFRRYRRHPTR